ncbi:hypothetical protein A2914_02960 [Candidatus Nomurabacteria bacterium RIFCSPLOWO2_01_FULL_41_21]|uniref:Uncharacterized protein n=2 Tax=Candidatus Nomuraibacteriota TaxID=1752729 RepID=A0A1F6V4A4_9BACT|nr:MAG: hypothetical protein A2733_01855 [Candidatus Nomurabacteria bacterium RIFCSPHIGHO2_01_FULL_40_20]OGI88104.1 MAG: hypothetical protein A2914_02960 [Candidatus Nomurabacteria bacterium RIFCSPLOWO2_01_FULL_41_21]
MESFIEFKDAHKKLFTGLSDQDIAFIRRHFGHKMGVLTQIIERVRKIERVIVLREIAEKEKEREVENNRKSAIMHHGKFPESMKGKGHVFEG